MRRPGLFLSLLLIVVAAAGCRPAAPRSDVAVYFIRTERTAFTLAEGRRTVSGGGTAPRIRAALERLLAGPSAAEQAQGLSTAIPAGTELRGVRVDGGVVWADFSREVESGGGSASMQGRFWQIVYTATQFPDAPRVRILIEGEAKATLGGEGVIIEEPVGRPATPPRF